MLKPTGFIVFLYFLTNGFTYGAKPVFKLAKHKTNVEVYDCVELILTCENPFVGNPFTGIAITGIFKNAEGVTQTVAGFCDSPDGRVFKVRYMPDRLGKYDYELKISCNGKTSLLKGNFTAQKADLRGPLRVDKKYPWHFVYEGTNEHFFWNSTTAYFLLGWKDEQIIEKAIDRLAELGVNRIRVAINGRQDDGIRWSEPLVKESANFTFKLNPWMAKNPQDLDNPQFDVTRFNITHWQKLDRLVVRARDKNIIISLIFYVDGRDHGCDPFKKENMGNEDEQRYYQYAIARYAGYPNIMWDIANEYHLFRSEAWVEKMGNLIKAKDPVGHLVSVHGNAEFPFRTSPWVDVVLYQSWDECGGYDFIINCKKLQEASGKIIPQVNEEYGYEDHYPVWGCNNTAPKEWGGRSAKNRTQIAWEIYMAGGYQTAGERANDGTGAGKDTGGGWINGRGNDEMTLFKSYGIIKKVFEQVPYWKMKPSPELVSSGNLCLALPGEEYLIYARLSYCRVTLQKGKAYAVTMIDPFTGDSVRLPDTKPDYDDWQYTKELDSDKVFIIKKK